MADFCRQCSKDVLGVDGSDLEGLITEQDTLDGFVSGVVICEGCGPIQVDHAGKCVSTDCMKDGHKCVE